MIRIYMYMRKQVKGESEKDKEDIIRDYGGGGGYERSFNIFMEFVFLGCVSADVIYSTPRIDSMYEFAEPYGTVV